MGRIGTEEGSNIRTLNRPPVSSLQQVLALYISSVGSQSLKAIQIDVRQ